MGFGLLFFSLGKKGTNKKPNFVLKVPFQHKPLSQPKVPPQHHSATHLCISSFKAAPPIKHSSIHKYCQKPDTESKTPSNDEAKSPKKES